MEVEKLKIGDLKKLIPGNASDICMRYELSDPASELLDDAIDSRTFAKSLFEKEYYEDLLIFLCYTLPKRELIWWGYLVASDLETEQVSSQSVHALSRIKEWVYRPNDDLRFELEEYANQKKFKTVSSWVAMGVFWSGGSIVANDLPKVEPDETLTAKALVGAIRLAGVIEKPENKENNLKSFLARGLDIANGGSGEL